MNTDLETINRIDRHDFVELLGGIYEHSSWVAAEVFELRPFTSIEQLHQHMAAIVAGASEDHRLNLLRAHPELAGKAAVRGDLTAESKREQAGAGLDQCSPEELEQIQHYNQAYLDKFYFPFIIAVTGLDRQQIIAAMAERLDNRHDIEFETALAEVDKIARIRLDALIDA